MQTEVDHGAIKTGQLLTIIWLIAAYVTGRWEVLAALTAVFALTSISASIGPLVLLYRFVLLPLRIARQDIRVDNPQPHQFGQAIGAIVAAIATYLLYSGQASIGWGLVWLLIVLTAISYLGWCAGCFTYYLLNRLGIKGFFKHTPTDPDVFLGNRPKVRTGTTVFIRIKERDSSHDRACVDITTCGFPYAHWLLRFQKTPAAGGQQLCPQRRPSRHT